MNKIDVVNEFIGETLKLEETINMLNNRLIPEFRLGNEDLTEFKTVSLKIKHSSEKLEKALQSVEEIS